MCVCVWGCKISRLISESQKILGIVPSSFFCSDLPLFALSVPACGSGCHSGSGWWYSPPKLCKANSLCCSQLEEMPPFKAGITAGAFLSLSVGCIDLLLLFCCLCSCFSYFLVQAAKNSWGDLLHSLPGSPLHSYLCYLWSQGIKPLHKCVLCKNNPQAACVSQGLGPTLDSSRVRYFIYLIHLMLYLNWMINNCFLMSGISQETRAASEDLQSLL